MEELNFMELEGRIFTDEYNNKYTLNKKISDGGQGVVYSTDNPEIVVKILFDNQIKRKQFTNFKIFSVTQDIDVTFPVSSLQEVKGYTMSLLSDMISFEKFFDKPREFGENDLSLKRMHYYDDEDDYEYQDEYIINSIFKDEKRVNEWIELIPEEMAEVFRNYIDTGGAILRLTAFLKIAINLAKLHSLGLVYCDISECNLFITNGDFDDIINNFNVVLIDCDNINFQASIGKKGLYTHPYGAPEVVASKGCSFASDCYSFFITLFWQVTKTHPFKGPLVEDDFDVDNIQTIQDKLNNGEFPWILDREDYSNTFIDNIYQTKIPYDNIFSDSMLDYFDAMFCNDGKFNPMTRPTIYTIMHALYNEVNSVIRCDYCEMDFNYFKHKDCPYCDTVKDKFMIISTGNGNKMVANIGKTIYVRKSILTNDIVKDYSGIAFKITYDEEKHITSIYKNAPFKKVTINGQEFYGKYETDEDNIKVEIDDNPLFTIEIEVICSGH